MSFESYAWGERSVNLVLCVVGLLRAGGRRWSVGSAERSLGLAFGFQLDPFVRTDG